MGVVVKAVQRVRNRIAEIVLAEAFQSCLKCFAVPCSGFHEVIRLVLVTS